MLDEALLRMYMEVLCDLMIPDADQRLILSLLFKKPTNAIDEIFNGFL
jgi:hypothetical protein